MTNFSLKEQLQALSGGLSSEPSKQPSEHKSNHIKNNYKKRPKSHIQPGGGGEKPIKQKPAWLEQAQYGVELLKAYYPNCFKETKDIQPVKVGIKQDLVKNLSTHDEITMSDKACMVSSLAYYVNSVGYHKSVVAGATRIDLDGNSAGTVTAEEAQYSADSRKAKLQKKQGAKPNNSVEEPVAK